MKHLVLTVLVLLAGVAHAENLKSLVAKAKSAVAEQLFQEGDNTLEVGTPDIATTKNDGLVFTMNVGSRSVHNGKITSYTCAVSFANMGESFEVTNTICK